MCVSPRDIAFLTCSYEARFHRNYGKRKSNNNNNNTKPTHTLMNAQEKILIGIELEYPNPVLLPFDLFLFVHTCTHAHTTYIP